MGLSPPLCTRSQLICTNMVALHIPPQELGESYLAKLFSNELSLYHIFTKQNAKWTTGQHVTAKQSKELDQLKGIATGFAMFTGNFVSISWFTVHMYQVLFPLQEI